MTAGNRRRIPEKWEPIFAAAGVRFSYRGLADAANRDTSLVIRVLDGVNVEPDAIDDVAEALKISPERLKELRGDPQLDPFTLPPEADQLNKAEREAVKGVVRAILRAKGLSDDAEGGGDPRVGAVQRAAARNHRIKHGDEGGEVGQRG